MSFINCFNCLSDSVFAVIGPSAPPAADTFFFTFFGFFSDVLAAFFFLGLLLD